VSEQVLMHVLKSLSHISENDLGRVFETLSFVFVFFFLEEVVYEAVFSYVKNLALVPSSHLPFA
jgi:hypothetical protein